MNYEILCETGCELGEGPTYDPQTDTAFWFDIVGCKLFEHRFQDHTIEIHDLPVMASALGVIDEASQLLVTEHGLYRRRVADGAVELLAAVEMDDPRTRSNDARVHPSGAFWFSTMGKNAEAELGSIYHFFRGAVTPLFTDITIANSICFSPKGDIAYFCDTVLGKIMRLDVDPKTGLPLAKPEIHYDHGASAGGIDGSIVDANGNLWNARWGAASLVMHRPDGTIDQEVSLPFSQPTCAAFVGPNADRLLVTSAWQGMDKDERSKDRLAGKTILLNLPVSGRHEPRVVS